MSLFIGTSGWAYTEWKPDFYPADLPRSAFLSHYSERLTACEINATFYRLQSEGTFQKWAAATSGSFRFAAKAHRRITHARALGLSPERSEFVAAFFRSLEPLRPRLGAVLLQFPPYRSRDDEALTALLDALPEGLGYAFEFRNPSWEHHEVGALIGARGATLCLADKGGEPPESLPPGPLAYVRLRAERYDDDQRARWLDLLTSEAMQRDVYAFVKHEGVAADDAYTGVGLACWLAQSSRARSLG